MGLEFLRENGACRVKNYESQPFLLDEGLMEAEDAIVFRWLESGSGDRDTSIEQQIARQVELGRALALDPKILLLDEPMGGCNHEEKEDMARFILDVNQEWGTTIILIEHDMGVVMDISDRIAVLDMGQKIAQGSPDAYVEARLLQHLAHGSLEVRLTGDELALWEAPVVVAGPMDDGHLDRRLAVERAGVSPHDAARGADADRAHEAHLRQRFRFSSDQESRNAARAAADRARWRSTSRPASNA